MNIICLKKNYYNVSYPVTVMDYGSYRIDLSKMFFKYLIRLMFW